MTHTHTHTACVTRSGEGERRRSTFPAKSVKLMKNIKTDRHTQSVEATNLRCASICNSNLHRLGVCSTYQTSSQSPSPPPPSWSSSSSSPLSPQNACQDVMMVIIIIIIITQRACQVHLSLMQRIHKVKKLDLEDKATSTVVSKR